MHLDKRESIFAFQQDIIIPSFFCFFLHSFFLLAYSFCLWKIMSINVFNPEICTEVISEICLHIHSKILNIKISCNSQT